MAVNVSPFGPKPQFELSSGAPAVGNLLFFYVAGSTSTKQNTYTDSTGGVANSNPIILNSLGQPTNEIWFTAGQSYKVVYAPSTDTDPPTSPIWTIDNLRGINDTTVTIDEWVAGPAPTFVSAVSFTLVGDQTSTFSEGRRLKIVDSGGTKYCTITGSAFGALTTITVAGDALATPTSSVSYSLISATNPSISSEMIYRKGAAVASAATCDIWNTAGDFLHITGNTGPITSFGTAPYAGAEKTLIFDSTPAITHNAVSLILPGGLSITAAAGDRAIVRADTTANAIVTDFIKAAGTPIIQPPMQKFIAGLTYANNAGDATNDIDIATGAATDSTSAYVMTLASTLTKQSDAAWAVGTNQGGLDTGAVGNSDYYIWLIVRTDTGVVDVLYSLSSTAPTMPASYTLKRLIGWFKRVGGTIVAFHTYEIEGGGLEMTWDVPTLEVSLANTLTTARRTDTMKVPLNFSVRSHLNVMTTDASSGAACWIYCPDQTDTAPSDTLAPLNNLRINTNSTSRQLFVRTSSTGTIAARSTLATVDFYGVSTIGFEWARRN